MFHFNRLSLCLVCFLSCFGWGCLQGPQQDSEATETDAGPSRPSRSARVGVGKKGDGYGNAAPILKPAATYWKVKEKIAFDILIPKNVQLFEATEGRKPKSHEEFMDRIIRAGKIELPDLDAGLEYFYDAQTNELMVRSIPGTSASSPR